MTSATHSDGTVYFSAPTTVTGGVDTTFSDTNTGLPANWQAGGTAMHHKDLNLLSSGSAGDSYVSLGGSTNLSPSPAAGTVTVT